MSNDLRREFALPAIHVHGGPQRQFARGMIEGIALWFLLAALILKLLWPTSNAIEFARALPIALVTFIPFSIVFILPLAFLASHRGNRSRALGLWIAWLSLLVYMIGFCVYWGILPL
jgi:hypothetical protein